MKCQSLFSEGKQIKIISLPPAELAQRLVTVKTNEDLIINTSDDLYIVTVQSGIITEQLFFFITISVQG